jgi:transcription antitermination factor NusG
MAKRKAHCWGVLVTEPSRERYAGMNLRASGHQPYVPLYWNGHQRLALFPNYIFCLINDTWQSVSRVRGVKRWILGGSKPQPLPVLVVPELQSWENKNGNIVLPPQFEPGQEVTITKGRFAGQVAIYDGMTPSHRERVLLSLLGQTVPAEVGWSEITAA